MLKVLKVKEVFRMRVNLSSRPVSCLATMHIACIHVALSVCRAHPARRRITDGHGLRRRPTLHGADSDHVLLIPPIPLVRPGAYPTGPPPWATPCGGGTT